jgi:peptide subunit release factor 1 (eRF1)
MARRLESAPAEFSLPNEAELRRLARFRSREGVLSLYIDFSPAAGERRDPGAAFMDAVKSLDISLLSARQQDRLEEEQRFIREYARGKFMVEGRSAILFSCQPRGLRRLFQLQVPVRPLTRFAVRPALAQLAAIVDEYERYMVALINKDEARLISVYMERPQARARVTDTYPGRTRRGGWAEARYSHHRDAHLHEHVLHVTEALLEEQRREPFDRLLLGGPDEPRAALLQVLPRSLRSRVAGSFRAELFLSDDDVAGRVREQEAMVQREAQGGLVDQLLDAGAKGLVTLGWDDTLGALQEGRVHKLVLSADRTRAGRVCPAGHTATIEPITTCPFCGGGLEAVTDLAEWAVEKALDSDARIETMHAYAAETLAERGDGIGAVLRW